MTTDLETEIRDALHARVQHVTADSLRHAEHDEVVIPLRTMVTKPRRRPSAWLSVAAAVAAGMAVAFVAIIVSRPSGLVRPAGSSAPVVDQIMPQKAMTAKDLTVPFTVSTSSGWSLLQIHSTADGILLGYAHGPLQVFVAPLDAPPGWKFGRGTFTVDGHPARYYESLSNRDGSPATATDPAVGQFITRFLSVQTDDGRQVVLQGGKGESTPKAQLLAWAHEIDFDRSTPLPSPLRLSRAPADTALVELDWSTHDAADNRDVRTDGTLYRFEATYQPPSAVGPNIGVWLQSWAPDAAADGAQERTIAGHPGYLYSAGGGLMVELGPGAYLGFGGIFGKTTRAATDDELIAAAESVSIAPDVDDRSTWFDAADALPLG